MNSFRLAFEDKRFSFICILLAVGFVYLPVLGTDFLHTDDWFWSYWGGFSCQGVVKWILPIGRPLAGLIYCLFPIVTKFSLVWIFRLINILNIVAIGFLLWNWLIRWKIEAFVAFLITVLTVTLPAFNVFASYISTLPHCFAVTVSFLAAFLVDASMTQQDSEKKIKLRVLAVLLLIASFSLNQASALFYVASLAVPILMSNSEDFEKVWPKKLLTYALVLIAAMGIYYVTFRMSAEIFQFRNVGKYDGRNFVQGYGKRLKWFFSNPLFETSNLWFINPTVYLRNAVLFLISGIIAWDYNKASQSKRSLLLKYTALLLLFPVGYGISLVSSDPSKEYRTYAALGSVFVFFIFIGIYSNSMRYLSKSYANKVIALFSVVAVMASVVAHQTVFEYFSLSDSAEYHFVRNEIKNYIATKKELKNIHVIVTHGPIAVASQRNEIGEPIMRHTPNIEPVLRAALSELGDYPMPKITTAQSIDDSNWVELIFDHNTIELQQIPNPPSQNGVLIIDMNKFKLI